MQLFFGVTKEMFVVVDVYYEHFVVQGYSACEFNIKKMLMKEKFNNKWVQNSRFVKILLLGHKKREKIETFFFESSRWRKNGNFILCVHWAVSQSNGSLINPYFWCLFSEGWTAEISFHSFERVEIYCFKIDWNHKAIESFKFKFIFRDCNKSSQWTYIHLVLKRSS